MAQRQLYFFILLILYKIITLGPVLALIGYYFSNEFNSRIIFIGVLNFIFALDYYSIQVLGSIKMQLNIYCLFFPCFYCNCCGFITDVGDNELCCLGL